MLPTFIIGGVGKAGTTALWTCMEEHPQICMARIKEPRFFSMVKGRDKGADERAHTRSGNYHKGIEWYEDLYSDCDQALALGEATTHYLTDPNSARCIHEIVPNVRMIFILREPVGRMLSQYWEETKQGERLPSFEEMYRKNHPRFERYLENSNYKKHLERYFSLFSPDQILVLLHDELRERPVETVQKVYEYIGVDCRFVPVSISREINPSGKPRIVVLQRIIRKISHKGIIEHFPGPVRRASSKMKRVIKEWNKVKFTYEPLNPDLRKEIAKIFEQDNRYVEEIVGRDLSHWRA